MILVSTHNLGSVPEFCDRAVLLNRTVLAAGPTEEVFTQANLEKAFGGVLRHFVLDAKPRATMPLRWMSSPTTSGRSSSTATKPRMPQGIAAANPTGRRRRAHLMAQLLEPFAYDYMVNAMWVSALVGAVCAFLSAYLMLKGWSLIGDALSHAIVPGVAGAYMLGLPFSVGAFLSGGLAAGAMLFLNQRTKLKEDAIIGLIFTSFFGLGLFMVSLSPTSVNIQTIVLGNILAITPEDTLQLVIIGMRVARHSAGQVEGPDGHLLRREPCPLGRSQSDRSESPVLHPARACTVAALQTVGAFLVIAMVVTPGATAYLLTDRFPRLIVISVAVGALTSCFGAYLSYFLDGATGGIIIVLQTLVFLTAFFLAPKHGLLAARRRMRAASEVEPMISLFDTLALPLHLSRSCGKPS